MEAVAEKLITAEEFMTMPDPIDGSRQELVRGRIVTMPPAQAPHGFSCLSIGSRIFVHSQTNRLGFAVSNDTGILLERDPDTLRAADVAYWSFARLPKLPKGYIEVAPDLAVEVISPGNTQKKIAQKLRLYFFNGTKRVWVVYPEARMVAVYKSPADPTILDEEGELDGEDVLPGFRCKVADLFPPAE